MAVMWKWIRRFLAGLLLLTGIAAVLLSVHVYQTVSWSYRCLPDWDGTVAGCPLDNSVTVLRDEWGIPHIRAATEADAHFALGYCMAQDRLFQMECFQRMAHGQLSEILGPPLVKADCLIRLMGVGDLAQRVAAHPEELFPEEMLSSMHAFLAGINHFIGEGVLPWEFHALKIPCRPFALEDCLAVAGTLPISFADGLRTDLMKSMIREKIPEYDADVLFNGLEKIPVTIMESLEEATALQQAWMEEEKPTAETIAGVHQAATWLRLVMSPDWRQAPPGSNSWVLSGDRTKSGKPILANDPHIIFTNPSIWYEAHVSAGSFECYGYYMTPLPVPLIAHNDFCGWALTMLNTDDTDLQLLRLNPDNPNEYFHEGNWHPFTVEQHRISVRFGKDRYYECRSCPLGVLCCDFFKLLHAYDGPPLAVSWSGKTGGCFADLCGFYEMAHARNYEAFEQGVRKITAYRVNVSYADRDGTIAWWGTGTLSYYPPGVDSKSVIPAEKAASVKRNLYHAQDWLHLKNPPEGMIVTANNLPTAGPVGTAPCEISRLSGYFKPGDRAGRIREILESRKDWTIEALRAVQTDIQGYALRPLVSRMIALAESGMKEQDAASEEALRRLKRWDGRQSTDSVETTLFHFWLDSLFQELFSDKLDPELFRLYVACEDHWYAMQQLLDDRENLWWDRRATEDKETAAEAAARALQDACVRMKKELGANMRDWRWGRVHQLTFTHPFGYLPLLGRRVNIGPLEAPGANQTINNMVSKELHRYPVIAGPSTRRLIDFADPGRSLSILPTGNSGHLRSPHYADQAPLFMRGEYRYAFLSRDEAEKHGMHRLTLQP